jgi:hypothetical protein
LFGPLLPFPFSRLPLLFLGTLTFFACLTGFLLDLLAVLLRNPLLGHRDKGQENANSERCTVGKRKAKRHDRSPYMDAIGLKP